MALTIGTARRRQSLRAGKAWTYPVGAMTKLLEKAVETVRKLASDSQNEIARAMLALAGGAEPVDPAHLPAVLEGLAQARRGEYASVADVEAAFRRFES